MPNHVTNILEFDCSKERAKEIMDFLRKDDDVYGSIDFNKLIPMPENLNIEAGSATDHGIEIYLTAVNPRTKDYGYEKMDLREFRNLSRRLDNERAFCSYDTMLSEENIQSYTKNQSFDEVFSIGEQAVSNIVQYGATTWYSWRIENWGSKWNAYDCVEKEPGDDWMEFLTAWDPVPDIVQKISEQFPEATVHYSWADEDIGSNTGRMDFKDGQIIMRDIPESGSYHAFEIACEVQGYDISEFDVQPDPENAQKSAKAKVGSAR